MDRQRFLEALIEHFNSNELRLLCFDLGVDYENLSGDTKTIKCLELLLYSQRRSKMADLLAACQKARPEMDWRELAGPTPRVDPAAGWNERQPSPPISTDSDASIATQSASARKGVFISYSHKDKQWLERLQTMLKPLVRQGSVLVWADTGIQTGTRWRTEIQKGLDAAKVGVMLVSPDFLASDFIYGQELPQLLKASEEGGLRICWVLLSQCLYETSPLAGFQAAHDVSHPLNSLSDAELNRVLAQICNEILRLSRDGP